MMMFSLQVLFVLVLLKTVDLTSWPALRWVFSRSVGLAAFILSARKRRSARRSISRALGASVRREIRILLGSFVSFWTDLFDLVLLPGEPDSLSRITVLGLDRLEDALQHGRGAILWESNSFGRRNLAKKVLHSKGITLDQLHLARHIGGLSAPKGWSSSLGRSLKRGFAALERRFVGQIVEMSDVPDSLAYTRRLLQVLKVNGVLCSAGDGRVGYRLLSFPFLGSQVRRSPGLLALSRQAEAPIFPLFCYQREGGEMIVEIAGQIETGSAHDDREEAARRGLQQYLRELENRVLKYPEQFNGWRTITSPDTGKDAS